MATPYENIYSGFYTLLVNDKKFFNYNELTQSEIESLVSDHSLNLMKKSINYIYIFGVPQIQLNKFDDMLEQIMSDLNDKEIDLINEGMYYFYAREDYNKIKAMGITFKSSELNLFSPASDRKSIMELVNSLKDELDYKIQSYLNRDRVTGKLKNVK